MQRDSNGEPLYFVTTLVDITDRKQAENALRQYEHIVSSTSDMLALIDKGFTYLSGNKYFLLANFAKLGVFLQNYFLSVF